MAVAVAEPEQPKIKVTRVFNRLQASDATTVVLIGGARSGKSHAVAQHFLLGKGGFIQGENKRFLFMRKIYNDMLQSVNDMVIEKILKRLPTGDPEISVYDVCNHRKSPGREYIDFEPRKGVKNTIVFSGMDTSHKVLSTEYNGVWLEEGWEFTEENYLFLRTRLSGPVKEGEHNQIILSLNPMDEFDWINQKLIHWADVELIRSTYHDNPTLTPQFIANMERLKEQDLNAYTVFAMGEYAQSDLIIYPEFISEDNAPWPADDDFDEKWYAADFGYTNPSCLLELRAKYDPDRMLPDVYFRELIYQSKLNNAALIRLCENSIRGDDRELPIYCDHAQPEKIEELNQAGFNAVPADKAVEYGIEFTRRLRVHTCRENKNANKERHRYMYRTDRLNNIIDGSPVKFNDHAMDALRYGCYTHLSPLMTCMPELTVMGEPGPVEKEPQVRYKIGVDEDKEWYSPMGVTDEMRDAMVNREACWVH
jgi:phage terminase large subunit